VFSPPDQSERGRRNPEDYVVVGQLRIKIWLGQVASDCVASTSDCVQAMHTPSGEPSGLRMNRASRTGPSVVMNEGTVFLAMSKVASAICGCRLGCYRPWLAPHGTRTAIAVECRPQTRPVFAGYVSADRIHFHEGTHGMGEKVILLGVMQGKGPPTLGRHRGVRDRAVP
jgi:hypothetical protein